MLSIINCTTGHNLFCLILCKKSLPSFKSAQKNWLIDWLFISLSYIDNIGLSQFCFDWCSTAIAMPWCYQGKSGETLKLCSLSTMWWVFLVRRWHCYLIHFYIWLTVSVTLAGPLLISFVSTGRERLINRSWPVLGNFILM